MSSDSLEYDVVTIGFDSGTIDAIDEKAFVEHRDNREEAIRNLLDEWIKITRNIPIRESAIVNFPRGRFIIDQPASDW